MEFLTDKQKNWLRFTNIKIDKWMTVHSGFTFYEKPSMFSENETITFDEEKQSCGLFLIVKEFVNEDWVCCTASKFSLRDKSIYLLKKQITRRTVDERRFLSFFCFIPLVIYNGLKWSGERIQKEVKRIYQIK